MGPVYPSRAPAVPGTVADVAEILLFHHALGLTDGVRALVDDLGAAGHVVHLPDLYDGRTYTELGEGVDHAEELGFDTIRARGAAAAEGLPTDLVYVGLSLGVMPAQELAQTRAGARGAVLLHACVPLDFFGDGTWPADVPAQVHVMEDDDLGEVDIAREVAATTDPVELFVYPGDRHLFTDRSTPDHDEVAASLALRRVLAFLDQVG